MIAIVHNGVRLPLRVRQAIHNNAGNSAAAFVVCHNQRTAIAPDAAKRIAPTAAAPLPSRSSRSQTYAKKNATFSFRKMMPVYTHASGSANVGSRMNGERTAEADDPKPGIPLATYG